MTLYHGATYVPSHLPVPGFSHDAFSEATSKYPRRGRLLALNIALLEACLPELSPEAQRRANATLANLRAQLATND